MHAQKAHNLVGPGSGLGILVLIDKQFRYAIVVFECRNDVTVDPRIGAIDLYDDGQQWPDVQRLPHGKPSSDLRIHSTIIICFAIPQTRLGSRDERNRHGSAVAWTTTVAHR